MLRSLARRFEMRPKGDGGLVKDTSALGDRAQDETVVENVHLDEMQYGPRDDRVIVLPGPAGPSAGAAHHVRDAVDETPLVVVVMSGEHELHAEALEEGDEPVADVRIGPLVAGRVGGFMDRDDLPGCSGLGQGPFEPGELVRIVHTVRIEADELHVADRDRPPQRGHPEAPDLLEASPAGGVMVPHDREQPSARVEDVSERAENSVVEPVGIPVGVDVVPEQQQDVVGVAVAERHHRPRGVPLLDLSFTDVSGDRDAKERAAVERSGHPDALRRAFSMGEQRDGLPTKQDGEGRRDPKKEHYENEPSTSHRASDLHRYHPGPVDATPKGPGGPGSSVPTDIDLGDDLANDANLVGSKAAALAAAARLGLPVLPGFVLTTAFQGKVSEAVWSRYEALSGGSRRPLVVRSSSTIEDDLESSMAGRFTSVVGVLGADAFEEAVYEVLRSAGADGDAEPMAVLVQPLLDARCGGVMFGLDPVTGDRRRIVIEVVEGGPQRLVSGAATATRYVLSPRGRLLERVHSGPRLLGPLERRRLAVLATRTGRAFGGPQDVEWAFDRDGRLWLFQSRPITAAGEAAKARGPIFGPGPIAETFPDALRPIETELWLDPLRAAVRSALRVVGAVSSRQLDRSPVVLTVGGRVAADLDLLGALPRRRSIWRVLNPVPPARHLAAAWRIGTIRRLLPARCARLAQQTDRRVAAVPPLRELSDLELRWLLWRVRQELVAVYGHEVLAGMLLHDQTGRTATEIALERLAHGRASGLSPDQIVARWPVVIALVPPRIGWDGALPEAPRLAEPVSYDIPGLGPREALRLRGRWLQELTARAAAELDTRLHADGRLPDRGSACDLSLAELGRIVDGAEIPAADVLERRRLETAAAPLPAAFRLTVSGDVVPIRPPGRLGLAGTGAAEGRVVGRVHQLSEGPPDDGDILVVRVLDPSLAASLPSISGLVSETGSTLSHLAILAREVHVPTVVGVEDALTRFPPGALVLVDGSTGEVSLMATEGGDP